MPVLHNNVTINALVSLELDPATADSDFPTIVSKATRVGLRLNADRFG